MLLWGYVCHSWSEKHLNHDCPSHYWKCELSSDKRSCQSFLPRGISVEMYSAPVPNWYFLFRKDDIIWWTNACTQMYYISHLDHFVFTIAWLVHGSVKIEGSITSLMMYGPSSQCGKLYFGKLARLLFPHSIKPQSKTTIVIILTGYGSCCVCETNID